MRTIVDELTDCQYITEKIHGIIGSRFPSNTFCETDKELLIQDLNSNILIKNSPAIICIVDYATKSYLYVNDSIVNELDITVEELLYVGLGRALLNFEPAHRHLFLNELYPAIFETYAKFAPSGTAANIHVTYNTLLITNKKTLEWYFHQLSVLSCDALGYPRYAIKYLTNINDYKKDGTINFNIYRKGKSGYEETVYSRNFDEYEIYGMLSERELEIKKMVDLGFSTKTIAQKLFISELTVATHRKNIARKLNGK